MAFEIAVSGINAATYRNASGSDRTGYIIPESICEGNRINIFSICAMSGRDCQ